MTHFVKTTWLDKMAFDSQIDNHTIRLDDATPPGEDTGPGPKKLLLTSLAGCTGMDVAELLRKMRVTITGFELDVEADVSEEHPKVYTEIRLVYRFFGQDINPKKVEKAIALSQDKYCGVSAMLKKVCPIKYTIEYVHG